MGFEPSRAHISANQRLYHSAISSPGEKKSEILFCFKWNVHFFDSRSQRCFIINSLTGKVLSRCSKWAVSCSNLCQCSLVLLVLRYHLLVSCQSPLYANFKSKQPQSLAFRQQLMTRMIFTMYPRSKIFIFNFSHLCLSNFQQRLHVQPFTLPGYSMQESHFIKPGRNSFLYVILCKHVNISWRESHFG